VFKYLTQEESVVYNLSFYVGWHKYLFANIVFLDKLSVRSTQ